MDTTMEIEAVLEAFREFEKKGKKETCPILERVILDVAKTGVTMIPWSKFKTYFLFKMENVMDEFHASTSEQRGPPHPNIEYIPFDVMKERIVKIVDGYNGVPFTIQRLCELLTDPKRNYTGTDKFLRGVEKNVMVVSSMHPSSDRCINGPGTPKPVSRRKLKVTTSLCTNGVSGSTVNTETETEPHPEQGRGHHVGGSMFHGSQCLRGGRVKNKHRGAGDDFDRPHHEVKRLKVEHEAEAKQREPSGPTGSEKEKENSKENSKSSAGACEVVEEGLALGTIATSECSELSSTQTASYARQEASPESGTELDLSLQNMAHPERLVQSEKNPSSAGQDNGDGSSSCSSGSSSDGESTHSDTLAPASPSSTPDLPTEGAADHSECTESPTELEDND